MRAQAGRFTAHVCSPLHGAESWNNRSVRRSWYYCRNTGRGRTAAALRGQGMYSGCGPKQSIRPANTGRKAGPRGAAPRLPACSEAPRGLCCARARCSAPSMLVASNI